MSESEKPNGLRRAAIKAGMLAADAEPYHYPLRAPTLPPGVVPAGERPLIAMDTSTYDYLSTMYSAQGFPGYPYLAMLATRAEFRAMASALATELTREWIEFTSKETDGGGTSDKIAQIEEEFERLNVRGAIQRAAEHDCYFGRGQVYLDIAGADRKKPLILDKRVIPKGSLNRVVPVEAMWTTPSAYNANDPIAPDFYRPTKWFVLGQETHASRLLTVVTRPLPDMLKPAYNFSGMSLSQLAEPYVDNWLRTRQSVADLINNFSITALATAMDQVLEGNDDGTNLIDRATLFTQLRSNKGLMLLDKDREELVQINTPLGGLHELQAQSQEHMCAVSRLPAIILTGISPSGLNASSDGEIRTFYDWIAAQQEAHWSHMIDTILKAVQLSMFGEIDPDISFKFVPLYQLDPSQEAEIRSKDASTDTAYVAAGILDPQEVRERLARDPNSGYMGLDVNAEVTPPVDPTGETDPDEGDDDPPAADAEFDESKHKRADNGQFGSGGGGGAKASREGKASQAATKASRDADKAGTAEAHEAAHAAHAEAAGAHSEAAFREGTNTMGVSNREGIVKQHLAEMNRHASAAERLRAGTGVYKDANGHDRIASLTPAESKIEGSFHDAITRDTPKLIAAYHAKFGNIIDPDLVKTLSPEFEANPNLAAAVHEPSSRLAKLIFADALARKAAAGDDSPMVFTAGGSGSGKSTTKAGSLAQLGANPDASIYDSVLSNPDSAKKRIDTALAAQGGSVGIAYTNADIATALKFNAARKRSVSIDTLMHAHVGASDTLRELAEHYKDNPRVKFSVMNNRGTIDDIAPGTMGDVPKYEKFALREQLVKVAEGMLAAGKIDQAKFDLLTR